MKGNKDCCLACILVLKVVLVTSLLYLNCKVISKLEAWLFIKLLIFVSGTFNWALSQTFNIYCYVFNTGFDRLDKKSIKIDRKIVRKPNQGNPLKFSFSFLPCCVVV